MNEFISDFIYEFTGQERNRKQVSSHLQVLRLCLHRSRTASAQDVDIKQATKVVKPCPAVSSKNSVMLNSDFLLTSAPGSKEFLSLYCSKTSVQNFLSLSLVNRVYRTECLHHLASSMRFDFGSDSQALQQFCSTASPELVAEMRYLRIILMEGYMRDLPDLPDLPNLRSLAIDLWPRSPTRPGLGKRVWGTQTETLLANLGVTWAARARIRLEMRWTADCERFEQEYVEKGRWRRVVEIDENGAPDQERRLCRRCYELCGNGKTVREVQP